ncbi:MAG: endolytic transglycosylase MltG, partial [Hyphomicrobiales bacterium]|nr:endolytic transglycosylase MltG [Hyphomicrobiales bacterium]
MTDIAFESAPQSAPQAPPATGAAGATRETKAPRPPRRRRGGGRLSFLSALLTFSLVVAIAAIVGVVYVENLADAPGPLADKKTVFIPPRSYHADLVAKLQTEGVIDSPYWFEAVILLDGARGKLKAGEYEFAKGATMRQVERTLVEGKVVLHEINVPEGMTSQQAFERVNADQFLSGSVAAIPAEGSLLPDTYKFTRGFPRARLMAKMAAAQRAMVDKIWAGRDPSVPLASPLEMVTLASIVEKETGKRDERPHVASVFYNRLRLKMRLETDPTVVYGLVGGKGVLGHRLTKADLAQATPYNTYLIPGLPPGPIANPGRAALEAVAHPMQTKDLYFVADGTGGHAFAATLKDHLANVAKWRAIRDAQPAPADGQ